MIDPNAYDVAELDAIIDGVRKKFRDKLAADTGFFGQDKGVVNRIALTLEEKARYYVANRTRLAAEAEVLFASWTKNTQSTD